MRLVGGVQSGLGGFDCGLDILGVAAGGRVAAVQPLGQIHVSAAPGTEGAILGRAFTVADRAGHFRTSAKGIRARLRCSS